MKKLILLIVCLLAGSVLFLRTRTVLKDAEKPIPPKLIVCQVGILAWNDAVEYRNADLDITHPDSLLAQQISFGCVFEDEHSFMVVSLFSKNYPRNFIVVPKEWRTKFIPLAPIKEER